MTARIPRLVVLLLIVAATGLVLITPSPAEAYIGPGAGFALLSSFFVFLTTIIAAGFALLTWPIRAAIRAIRRLPRGPSDVGRVIIVGFDGQDPVLTDALLEAGELPNFAAIAADGAYRRLRTTYPSVSPVAWSSFSTGAHPARHNIFDFLDRDRRSYLPRLSSTEIIGSSRFLRLGRYRVPLNRPAFRLLRKSKPFWTILGEHGLWSTVLRVPITFPPDRFHGAQLSAMCVPDLTGTQGTFMLYTTRPPDAHVISDSREQGGVRITVTRHGDRIDAALPGPENPFVDGAPPMACAFSLNLSRRAPAGRGGAAARVEIGGRSVDLEVRTLSDWIPVKFKPAPFVTVSGLCRMMLLETGDHVSLYVTPINIDPDKPGMPISHPSFYATYLAKRIGPYSTLGLAEDTWALNEGVTDEATFLRQTYDIDAERQRMFFAALDTLRKGALVCVFDGTDRIQHMFWRYRDARHPARQSPPEGASHPGAIDDLYRHNDAFLGRVRARLRPDDVLIVLSDHGFTSFRRGVNLNGWLRQEGYLVLKAGTDGTSQWLRDVDWSATRAYALGLTGLYLNVKGREVGGVVAAGEEASRAKAEIMGKLRGLRDAGTGEVAINDAFDPERLYAGPYLENAPDLLIGYNAGYRVSWDCANGIVAGPVFEDNRKAWSGDHCVDPRLVPGVLFSTRPLGHADGSDPSLIDIAPTVLRMFGIEPPGHMDGRSLIGDEEPARMIARMLALVAAVLAVASGCGPSPHADKRVIVLGIDGMDYGLARELMAAGRMPNFSKLQHDGGFSPLATTNPPQSPVAWSSFITGEDPGRYGIYDFVHRDPATLQPFLSTTRTVPGRTVTISRWRIPVTSGRVELLRAGTPFWSALTRQGIETTIIRMPANYPPSGTATRELSGMGTPDLRGNYGTFSLFTSDPAHAVASSPDTVFPVTVQNGEVRAALLGPDNPLLVEQEPVAAPFVVYVDDRAPVVKLVVGTEERILHVGEWSDWVPIGFKLAPLQTLRGIARFYVKQAHPAFELYVSPINLDPVDPALPLSTPGGYAAELAAATGRYYTQGMPEDTKALSQGALTRDEFLAQAELAQAENLSQYRYVLGRFQRGLLFYYFGHLDQVSHMMWRARDPGHPAYDAVKDAPYAHVIDDLYVTFDGIVGETMRRMPADTTLIVMSDHGFTTWRRSFSLNTWLEQNGYLTVIDPNRRGSDVLGNVDWSRTRAYGLGLNGLYLNVRGRELHGIVAPESRAALAAEIAAKLEAFRDPATGQPAVMKAYRREEIYAAMDFPDLAPDVVVGYAAGTRVSNESALGAVPRDVLLDNHDEWSGDHCMDPRLVPGILLSSRPLRTSADSLQHLAAAVMAEFGIDRRLP